MPSLLHKADTRGSSQLGWLDSRHTFSFGGYRQPERMHFGVLRVLNDDIVAPGMGFGRHAHDNMEIVSLPLEGELEHRDSMGNVAIIRKGDIQVMSAGSGVEHSEYNRSEDHAVKFLQIWIIPNKRNVTPRYDQLSLDPAARHNRLQQILSPNADDEGIWIHQDAWFQLGVFDRGVSVPYALHKPGNGVYAFVLNGDFNINGQLLHARDGYGISDLSELSIQALSDGAELLLMEVPMKLP